MCRLLAVVSPVPRTPREVLGDAVVDVYRSMSRLHADGWGAAWIEEAGSEGGVPVLRSHRSPASAADDPAFDERTVSPSRATLSSSTCAGPRPAWTSPASTPTPL